MVKPILYIDVDGVLFGVYGQPEAMQLRPGVTSFLMWCTEHFDCRWLTCWPFEHLDEMLRRTYGDAYLAGKITYVDWHEASRNQGVSDRKTAGIAWDQEWFWIEDGPVGREIDDLRARGSMDRYIYVKPRGADELERIRTVLEERLSTLKDRKEEPNANGSA